jgi:hypothetical protein
MVGPGRLTFERLRVVPSGYARSQDSEDPFHLAGYIFTELIWMIGCVLV